APGVLQRNWKSSQVVRGRIDELARRVTTNTWKGSASAPRSPKEYIIEQLLDNAELARKSGTYGPRNRALELMGKEIGMFGDVQPPPPPTKLEDLPTSILEQLLE